MKKNIKRIISIFLAVTLFLTPVLFSTPVLAVETEATDEESTVGGLAAEFQLMLSNDNYELYYRADTAEVAIKNKATGYVWYTNPQDRAETVGSVGQSFNSLSSQLIVNYYESVELKAVDSFSQATSLGQTTHKVDGNTLSVEYNFGVHEFQIEMLPTVISEKFMNEKIFPYVDEDERALIESKYVFYDKADMDEELYDIVATSYPIISKHNIYILTKCATFIGEKIYNVFVEKAGYSTDWLDDICKENAVTNSYKAPVTFTFVLDYILTDDGFEVVLDCKKIVYDDETPPVQIDVLPFFAAANTSDAGYMFVPDGSGAVINYNNLKVEADRYWKTLFGDDAALRKEIDTDKSLPSVLPVFASASKNGNSYYASIDEAYEYSGVAAGIADEEYPYNYVYSFFKVVPFDKISIRDKGTEDDTSIMYPTKKYDGKVNISYHFLNEYATYDKIATEYRDYLIAEQVLDTEVNDDSYVNVEFYGTARVKKNFLGFTYTKLDAITSFDDAKGILEEFSQEKVDTVYTNAMSGGKQQNRVTNLKVASVLGSKKDLSAFMDSSDTGYLSYIARIGNADTWKSNSSYTLSREIAKVYGYDFISKYYNNKSYSVLLKPSLLKKQAETVAKAAKKKNIDGVNLIDIGYKLDSDFNRKGGTNRSEVRALQQDYLAKISENCDVSVDYGSIFSAKYVSKIWNIPMSSSGFAIEDKSVPFYQIVLRGTAAYVAPSINQAADARTALLNAAEYGAEIRYSWIAEAADKARLTDYSENYFDCLYTDSIEQAKAYSKEMKALFEKIGQSEIVSHKSISETLKETKFASGHTVYVNYAENAVEIAGQTVDAESFVCVSSAK